MANSRKWYMYGVRTGAVFLHVGSRTHIELIDRHADPTHVVVKEDAAGTYYGWLPTGSETPCFIFYDFALLDMCFPEGVRVEEQDGGGRVLRLTVEPSGV